MSTHALGESRSENEEIIAAVNDQLRALARRIGRGSAVTSQTTSIVNEAWIRLSSSGLNDSPRNFSALAAATVRSVVIDAARRARRAKRGGGWVRVPFDAVEAESNGLGTRARTTHSRDDDVDVLELDAALTVLQGINERRARIVELRFFGGLSVSQVGLALGIADRTVDREWHLARAWLRARLDEQT